MIMLITILLSAFFNIKINNVAIACISAIDVMLIHDIFPLLIGK